MNVIDSDNTFTPTVGVNHQVHSSAGPSTIVLMVDTSYMIAGDRVELTIDNQYETGGAYQQTYYTGFSHTQADPGKISVPVVVPYGVHCNIKQSAGSARVFPWVVVSI